MDDWDNFYMLAGGTAGTLIGLVFVVITLGINHAKAGDEMRTRLFARRSSSACKQWCRRYRR
jgi:hypothetical protein